MTFQFNFLPSSTAVEDNPTQYLSQNGVTTKNKVSNSSCKTCCTIDINSCPNVVIADKVCVENANEQNPECNEIYIYKRNVYDVVFQYALQDRMDNNHDPINELPRNDVGDQESSSIVKSINSNSDLIPGVYEGGLKTWECTFDLILYLSRHLQSLVSTDCSFRVLELGCGSALPGIYCLVNGNENVSVDFQDFNEDVLSNISIPNVLMNLNSATYQPEISNGSEFELDIDGILKTKKKCERIKFISGSWNDFPRFNRDAADRYDLIVSSETIYNRETYPDLLDIFRTQLSFNGVALFACKSHYFGCSGDAISFLEYVKLNSEWNGHMLEIEPVAEFGAQGTLKRLVLKIQWK